MTDVPQNEVDALVEGLSSKDATERFNARTSLVRLRSAATASLLNVLDASQQHTRWEAAKALVEIRDPAAANRLVVALADRDADVRWVVGEALIALRASAVKPLLNALTRSEPPEGLYKAAHHVLHDLAKHGTLADSLKPVIKALEQREPEIAVPVAAEKAMTELDR